MGSRKRIISREEVRVVLHVDEEFVDMLEREEIVRASEGGFEAPMVERIRVCHTLHHELGVNPAGIEVALRLLETIREERAQFGEVLAWLGRQLAGKTGRDAD